MHAVVFGRYGPPSVLEQVDLPRPVVRPGRLLVRVRAASVNPIDHKLREGKFAILSRWLLPKIVGNDFAGTVEAVGAGVDGFAVGTDVFGAIAPISASGTCAEFVLVRPSQLARRPAALSHVEAAALPIAGSAALAVLDGMTPGQSLLLLGASGGVGSLAVQIAARRGLHVTAVASAARHAALRAQGAQAVAEYDGMAFLGLGRRFDRIVDLAGRYRLATVGSLLARGGTFVASSPGPDAIANLVHALRHGQRARTLAARTDRARLTQLAALVAEGVRAPVTRVFPLGEVAAAHALIATGHTAGKLVIALDG